MERPRGRERPHSSSNVHECTTRGTVKDGAARAFIIPCPVGPPATSYCLPAQAPLAGGVSCFNAVASGRSGCNGVCVCVLCTRTTGSDGREDGRQLVLWVSRCSLSESTASIDCGEAA